MKLCKKDFFRLLCCKNVKENLLFYFRNLKLRRPLIVGILYSLRQADYKKEGENGNEDGRKGISFSRWDLCFLNNVHSTCFTGDSQKYILGKTNIDFQTKYRKSKRSKDI